jgi:hypothetical protein
MAWKSAVIYISSPDSMLTQIIMGYKRKGGAGIDKHFEGKIRNCLHPLHLGFIFGNVGKLIVFPKKGPN